jgi:uncharacterized damage-inducible protein DinB
MPIIAELLPEFDQEMAATRRVLERVPDDRPDWKPHPKSFSLAHLAQLVATMPGWITRTLREPSLDLAADPGYRNQTPDALLAQFDRHVVEAREAIATREDADWAEPWSLMMGGHAVFTSPRGEVVRQHVNHLVHHRAQLGVYLRLLDVPVPSMYGPTADEKWGV